MMTLQHWLGMACGVAVIAFIVFSFQQGEKVKPDDRRDGGPSVGGPGDGVEPI
jgi:hypothetical protein